MTCKPCERFQRGELTNGMIAGITLHLCEAPYDGTGELFDRCPCGCVLLGDPDLQLPELVRR